MMCNNEIHENLGQFVDYVMCPFREQVQINERRSVAQEGCCDKCDIVKRDGQYVCIKCDAVDRQTYRVCARRPCWRTETIQ